MAKNRRAALGNDRGRIAAAPTITQSKKTPLPALRTTRSTTTTTAATASGALLGLVHLQRSPVDIVAIQGLHGARSVCACHFNEAETTGPTGVAIIDQRNRLHCAMLFEQRTNRGLVH
jgi:fructose-1,6-bisphosphatase/inositol monophosphatase family enzyme